MSCIATIGHGWPEWVMLKLVVVVLLLLLLLLQATALTDTTGLYLQQNLWMTSPSGAKIWPFRPGAATTNSTLVIAATPGTSWALLNLQVDRGQRFIKSWP
jgi:hypothetical protein